MHLLNENDYKLVISWFEIIDFIYIMILRFFWFFGEFLFQNSKKSSFEVKKIMLFFKFDFHLDI